MIPLHSYENRAVAVFGLGKSGEATVRALLAGGAAVVAWDDNAVSRERLKSLALQGELAIAPPEKWDWREIACLALSPGVPLTHPAPHPVVQQAMAHGCRVTGDIELLHEACPDGFIIGITGTNGKSTTTALTGHILNQAGTNAEVGGNLGTPALSLAPVSRSRGVYVLELSSYQLDLIAAARINVSVLLNITPDHIDRHGGMDGYIAAKRRIFAGQRREDTAIIGVDDAYCEEIYREMKEGKDRPSFAPEGPDVMAISARREVKYGVFVKDGMLYDATLDAPQPQPQLDLRNIPALRGRHNWQNAAAAYAACRAYGMAPISIASHLRSFPGLRHRMQPVMVIRGVSFVNDSKATNADAAAKALGAFDAIYWIAGGKPKEGGIASLEEYFPRIRHAYLIGEAEEEFARTLQGKVKYARCGTLENALRAAAEQAFEDGAKGAAVLLSPACASFDQWRDFEQRGDAFCEAVLRMKQSEGSIVAQCSTY